MDIAVFTIFPSIIEGHAAESILGRAIERGRVRLEVVDIRDSACDRHRSVDDTVFGGGPGMVLRPDVVAAALDSHGAPGRRLFMSPAGRPLSQAFARELAGEDRLALLCGRYEGVDQRVLDSYEFEPVSIGDYVVAGGELAALVVVEAVTRLLPGVMGNVDSASSESFEDGLLEPPCYTRPAVWRGAAVPEVLLSGNHAAIAAWRRRAAIRRTAATRPDLLGSAGVSEDELRSAGVEPGTITRS